MVIEKNIKNFIVYKDDSIDLALKKITNNKSGYVIVVNHDGIPFGILTDGDFRRWLLTDSSKDLSQSVDLVANQNFKIAHEFTPLEQINEFGLNGIVIVFLLYVPLFLAFYRIMDSTLVEIYRNNLDPNILNYQFLMNKAIIFPYDNMVVLIVFKIFLTISGLMLVGSLYFNKMAIIKVALVSSTTLFIIIGVNYLFAKIFFGENISAMPFFDVSIKTDSYYRTIALPQQAQNIVNIIFLYLLPAFLYFIAFIRLKEKEF